MRSPGASTSGLMPPVTGRPAAREITDTIGVRLESVGGANGDDAFSVAGIGDADRAVGVELTGASQHALEAAIAGGGHHHDAAGDEALALFADRRAAAGVILDVVKQRQTEIDAVDDRLIGASRSDTG